MIFGPDMFSGIPTKSVEDLAREGLLIEPRTMKVVGTMPSARFPTVVPAQGREQVPSAWQVTPSEPPLAEELSPNQADLSVEESALSAVMPIRLDKVLISAAKPNAAPAIEAGDDSRSPSPTTPVSRAQKRKRTAQAGNSSDSDASPTSPPAKASRSMTKAQREAVRKARNAASAKASRQRNKELLERLSLQVDALERQLANEADDKAALMEQNGALRSQIEGLQQTVEVQADRLAQLEGLLRQEQQSTCDMSVDTASAILHGYDRACGLGNSLDEFGIDDPTFPFDPAALKLSGF